MDQDGESERRDKCKRGEKINVELSKSNFFGKNR
jgi:hypothetical protein